MFTTITHRPRNVNAIRSGAILYGDWGTSKVYVVGLAFAIAGYASFWLILAMSLLSVLIGINYITVCKLYPNGGGVYASVRHRSPIIAMVGAFFLIADFIVTAALSALSAGYYFGVPHPVIFAGLAILLVGALNFYGPKRVGTIAFVIIAIGFIVLTLLALSTLPFLTTAAEHIKPLQGSDWSIWQAFVGVVVALSGVEAVANSTGVMTLDPGSTEKNPRVTRTAAKAIIAVMLEATIYTSLFGFAIAAISGFEIVGGDVNAPGYPGVRDYMLRFMGETFVGDLIGPVAGKTFAWVLGIALGVLLLLAVNTAINGLVALLYLMASDGEVPRSFQKLNRYGVPVLPLIISTAVSAALVIGVADVAKLAAYYAIGFVGAIATNLTSASTNFKLPMSRTERGLMIAGSCIMLAIEITLFVDKPNARNYVILVILCGLLLRAFAQEFRFKKIFSPIPEMEMEGEPPMPEPAVGQPTILCAISRPGRALSTAIETSKKRGAPLHILFVREQKVLSDKDVTRTSEKDEVAAHLFNYAKNHADPHLTHYYYCVSDSKADIVVAYADRLNVTQLYMNMETKGPVLQFVRGSVLREITKILPEEVQLFVIP